MKLDDGIELVKQQVEFHKLQAAKHASERKRAAAHEQTAWRFGALLDELLYLKRWRDNHPNWDAYKGLPEVKPLALSWEEVADLPAEVMQELSISDSDIVEFNIQLAIRNAGGIASLDRIILNLYEATKETHKRMALNQKLYRMTQKGAIYAVPGRKGVYSLDQLSEEEAAALE